MMRAAVFEGTGKPLAIRDIAIPEPGAGELLIRVHRCGVCGSDLHMTDVHSCFNPAEGSVIGHEIAGEVVALGAGAEASWREGDRIAVLPFIGCGSCLPCLSGDPTQCANGRSQASGGAIGGFAEYCLASGRDSVRLSDKLSWEEGAFVEPVAVGVHTIAVAAIPVGARVLVLGAGPVGLAVAASARLCGADTIVVAARSDRRADLAITMGASDFLIADERLGENFAKRTGGQPEVIIECVGSPGMMDLAAGVSAARATIVMAGACMQVEPFMPIQATMKELIYKFAVAYSRRDFAFAEKLIASGRINPMPMFEGTVSMADFPAQFEALRTNKLACKIMLQP